MSLSVDSPIRIRSGLALIRDSENSVFIFRQLTYDLDEHVLSYGLSNLALGIPFHSTLRSCIWSTCSSSHLDLGHDSSSINCSISWPSSRLRLHIFLWWICAFGCRTRLVLDRDLLLPSERRFVPLFRLVHEEAFHFSILKKSNHWRVDFKDPWTGLLLTNFRTLWDYPILWIGRIAKVVLRSLHVVEQS